MGLDNLIVSAYVFRATTKNGRQLFGEEKCTPQKKIMATAKLLLLLLFMSVFSCFLR